MTGNIVCVVQLSDGSPCNNTPAVGRYCTNHEACLNRDLEILKMVSEHFRQDVREFWPRSNFYLVVDAALVSIFVQSNSESRYLLGIMGITVSVFWFLAAHGSIVWLQKWRAELRRLDDLVDSQAVFHRVEAYATTRPWHSPSWITQWLPLCFLAAWVALLIVH